MSDAARQYVKGLIAGLAFIAAAYGMSRVAAADTSPLSWVTPYAVVIFVLWLLAMTLGVAVAISLAGRLSVGVVLMLAAVPAYIVSTVSAGEGASAAVLDASAWVVALVTLVLPWGFGMAFGWSVLHHRDRRRRFG